MPEGGISKDTNDVVVIWASICPRWIPQVWRGDGPHVNRDVYKKHIQYYHYFPYYVNQAKISSLGFSIMLTSTLTSDKEGLGPTYTVSLMFDDQRYKVLQVDGLPVGATPPSANNATE